MKEERREKTREDREKRRERTRREKKQDKRRDKMKREKMKEKRWDEKEERWNEVNKSKKCWKTLKPARWISPKCFEKNPFRTNFSSIFLRKCRIWPFLNYLHYSNSILWAQGIKSEGVFGPKFFLRKIFNGKLLTKVWHCFDQDSRPAECACSVSVAKMINLLNDSYWKQTHATCTVQHADDWKTGERN